MRTSLIRTGAEGGTLEKMSGKKAILRARAFQVYQFIVATLCSLWLLSNNRAVGIIGGLLLAILAAIMISKPEFLPSHKRSAAAGDLPEFAHRLTRLWGVILLVAAVFVIANCRITTSAEFGIALLVFGITGVVCTSISQRIRMSIRIPGYLVLCGGGAFLIYVNAPISLHAESLWAALGSIAGGIIWSSIGWVVNRFGERGEAARLAEERGEMELSLPFASLPRHTRHTRSKHRPPLNR
jgi:hypothetical protein